MASTTGNIFVELPLKALIYRSRATIEITPLILTSIVDVSAHNNEQVGISGMLLFGEDRFVQYIEGSPRQIARCYQRIVNDSRHCDVELMMERNISKRAVPGWHMNLLYELSDQSAPVGDQDLVDYFRAAA